MSIHTNTDVEVDELTPEQGRELLNRLTWDSLSMSYDDFVKRYELGEYDGVDEPHITRIVMLMPFAG